MLIATLRAMPSTDSSQLDKVFAALAHPVRRDILARCGGETQNIRDLARPHDVSLNAISKHVKTLESAGLITRHKDGNFHRIRTSPESLRPAIDWLGYHTDLWEQSLLALKGKLETDL